MSTPSVTPGAFVPSRFLRRQLFAIALGSMVTLGTISLWPHLTKWLLASNFLPHAYCYLGNPRLVWTNAVTDSLVGIA